MIRWIFGLCFIVIALGMIIVHEYLSAVFMLMVVFVSFPPISNLLESELNILVSGAVRFLVVIILLAGSVAVDHDHSSSAVIYAHTSSGSYNNTQNDNVSYWDWEWHTLSHICDTKVPLGYE